MPQTPSHGRSSFTHKGNHADPGDRGAGIQERVRMELQRFRVQDGNGLIDTDFIEAAGLWQV